MQTIIGVALALAALAAPVGHRAVSLAPATRLRSLRDFCRTTRC